MNANFTSSRTIGIAAAGILLFVVGFGAGHFLSRGAAEETHGRPIAEDAKKELYTCGMHPNVIQEGPGICPICNMALVPVRGTAPEDGAQGRAAETIAIDPAVVRNIGVRTGEAERGPLRKTIRATGLVVEDETRVGIVNLKVEGWIERVHVDETGRTVRKGDPLLEIDSPQLATAQEEYLIALDNLRRLEGSAAPEIAQGARETFESARRRLLYWNVPEEEVARLERTREVRRAMTLRSPFTGVVASRDVFPGMRVMPGMDLYRIADLDVVWVQASVFDADLPFVSIGQKATLTLSFLPGRVFEGKVAFLAPVLDPMTRDLKVRLEFPNASGDLKPGMYADVSIESVLDEDAVLVPAEAVVRSGARDVVFLARGEGRFAPAEVLLGASGSGGVVQVLDGVLPGDRVVTSAQFLLDSESSFREAVKKMMEGKSGVFPAHSHAGRATSPAGAASLGDLPRIEGEPVRNALFVAPDGSITILCPVMKNEKTIAPGDVYSTYQGMRVYYCCPGCQADFDADPERYLAELDAALGARAQ
ncbi:MAG: efflux RND transporter periplasmic adaptor subunit [Candidatus Eisenbacteria bacterium]|nr:efflux RND transporter periplasmic adaptor subunit [Candidatus Eisenbacteria bacterium]